MEGTILARNQRYLMKKFQPSWCDLKKTFGQELFIIKVAIIDEISQLFGRV